MKICVYTCITGGYDQLIEPKVTPSGVDFICFSDKVIPSKTWMHRDIPSELQFLSDVKKQRVIKICPHRYLSEYDISVWVDGNIAIIGDITKFIVQYDLDVVPFYSRIHPRRNCIYDEAEACIAMKKDSELNIQQQIQKYRDEGYPEHTGMVETGILLRKHNDEKCVLLDNAWATELLQQSYRDQLSFNYVCWKQGFLPGYLTKNSRITANADSFFNLKVHHG